MFDFLFRQIQGVQSCQSSQLFDFFVDRLVSGYVDVSVFFYFYYPEVAHKVNQIVGMDFVFEHFDF